MRSIHYPIAALLADALQAALARLDDPSRYRSSDGFKVYAATTGEGGGDLREGVEKRTGDLSVRCELSPHGLSLSATFDPDDHSPRRHSPAESTRVMLSVWSPSHATARDLVRQLAAELVPQWEGKGVE